MPLDTLTPVPTARRAFGHPGVFLLATIVAACSDSPAGPAENTTPPPVPSVAFVPATLTLEQVAQGFTVPLHVAAPEGDDRLFVVERFGTIWIIEEGEIVSTPFLDVSAKIASDGSERGRAAPDHERRESSRPCCRATPLRARR